MAKNTAKNAGKPAARAARKSYRDTEHTHVLAPRRGQYRELRCTLRGCRYSEWWDGKQYRPRADSAGRIVTPATAATLVKQSRAAIRPCSLWGEMQP